MQVWNARARVLRWTSVVDLMATALAPEWRAAGMEIGEPEDMEWGSTKAPSSTRAAT